MIIVSFYHDIDGHTYYSDHAERLAAQCDKLGITHIIRHYDCGSDWITVERAKATFICEMLMELKQDFVWLDVDCDVFSAFEDFNIIGDWGFVWREDGVPCDYVHYIKYNEYNMNFLLNWVDEIKRCGKGSHTAFMNIYRQLDYFTLPNGYFKLGLAETKSKTEYLRSQE